MAALRLVRQPNLRPQRCALIPFLGATREPVGFFDFGTELFGGDHVYVSWTAFRQMAEYAHYVPASRGEDVEVASLRAQLEEAQAALASAEKQLDAVETLRKGGYTPARRPGRPKKETDRVVEVKEKVTA